MLPALKKFLIAATAEEIRDLAAASGTTPAYLAQLAAGERDMKNVLAVALEKNADVLREKRPELPPLSLGDLNSTCAACKYFNKCKGSK